MSFIENTGLFLSATLPFCDCFREEFRRLEELNEKLLANNQKMARVKIEEMLGGAVALMGRIFCAGNTWERRPTDLMMALTCG